MKLFALLEAVLFMIDKFEVVWGWMSASVERILVLVTFAIAGVIVFIAFVWEKLSGVQSPERELDRLIDDVSLAINDLNTLLAEAGRQRITGEQLHTNRLKARFPRRN